MRCPGKRREAAKDSPNPGRDYSQWLRATLLAVQPAPYPAERGVLPQGGMLHHVVQFHLSIAQTLADPVCRWVAALL